MQKNFHENHDDVCATMWVEYPWKYTDAAMSLDVLVLKWGHNLLRVGAGVIVDEHKLGPL